MSAEKSNEIQYWRKVILMNTERRWWNQVKADMRKIGATEEDAEDQLKWRGLADLGNGFPGFKLIIQRVLK